LIENLLKINKQTNKMTIKGVKNIIFFEIILIDKILVKKKLLKITIIKKNTMAINKINFILNYNYSSKSVII
jgi:hypothetical protein